MKNFFFFLIFSTFFVSACNEEVDENIVLGDWACAEFIEQGQPKDVKAQNIRFSFFDNDTYSYNTTNYQEAGNYRLKGRLLYTTDTLANQRIEKSVKIIHSTMDSLYFEMNAGGIEQVIKLHKAK